MKLVWQQQQQLRIFHQSPLPISQHELLLRGRNSAGASYISTSEEILVYVRADKEVFSVRTLPSHPDRLFFGTRDDVQLQGPRVHGITSWHFSSLPTVAPGVGCNPIWLKRWGAPSSEGWSNRFKVSYHAWQRHSHREMQILWLQSLPVWSHHKFFSPASRHSLFCPFISNSRIWSLGLSNLWRGVTPHRPIIHCIHLCCFIDHWTVWWNRKLFY